MTAEVTLDVTSVEALADAVLRAPRSAKRRLVALVGAPASGKSTLAGQLCEALNTRACAAQVVPMDGFHLHNQILIDRGLMRRKGAPQTFDLSGLAHLLARLGQQEDTYIPIFDRRRDIAIAAGALVPADCDTVIVEGNYLMFDQPGWRDLAPVWDLSVRLDVPWEVLKSRLVARWLTHGLTPEDAEKRATENDLINARSVAEHALPCSLRFTATA